MSDDGYRWKALGARIREARVRAGLTQMLRSVSI